MKKGIVLLVGLMTLGTTVQANDITPKPVNRIGVNYNYSDAISFVERGIKFHVFLNGDFDFNTKYRNDKYVDYNGRRNHVNSHRGVRVERNYNGQIRRVGNTIINYNRRGDVNQIGSVFIDYRRGQLTNVGHLKVKYDRWGNPHFYGNVKHNTYYQSNNYNSGIGINVNIGQVCDYNDAYFYRNDFRNNYSQIREDQNFYYYRARPNAKIGKKNKVLKRRKPTKRVFRERTSKRNTQNRNLRKGYKAQPIKKVDTHKRKSRR